MTKDLGVWTAEDCALVLIDYQNEMFEVIRSETPANLVELDVPAAGQGRQGVWHADRPFDSGREVRFQRTQHRARVRHPRRAGRRRLGLGTAGTPGAGFSHGREVVPRRTVHHPVPAHTPGP